jgi:limonene-1,2-epoxide hydrolase
MLVVATAACATRTESRPTGAGDGVAASLVVEQFLAAANANDLDAMARVFGTKEGPVGESLTVEQRDEWLFAIASVVRHDDYELAGTGIVPGRRDVATLINVRMRFGERQVVVPFTVVRTARWGWLVEQVDLEKITNPPPVRRARPPHSWDG